MDHAVDATFTAATQDDKRTNRKDFGQSNDSIENRKQEKKYLRFRKTKEGFEKQLRKQKLLLTARSISVNFTDYS